MFSCDDAGSPGVFPQTVAAACSSVSRPWALVVVVVVEQGGMQIRASKLRPAAIR